MTSSEEMVATALRKAFPGAADADVRRYAKRITLRTILGAANNYVQSGRGPATGRQDLEKLHRGLQRALAAALNCRPDACQALLGQKVLQSDLKNTLLNFMEAVREAHDALPSDAGPPRVGSPPDRLGPNIAAHCAKAYEALSGKSATVRTKVSDSSAYGPFYDLVIAVFKALQIKSSVEHSTRKFIKTQERRKPPKTGE